MSDGGHFYKVAAEISPAWSRLDFEHRRLRNCHSPQESKAQLSNNLGISKKIGLTAYSSPGASCNVRIELDQALMFDDAEGFQRHVKQIFAICRQAVQEVLAQQRAVKMEGTAPTQINGQSNSKNCISPKQVELRRIGVDRRAENAKVPEAKLSIALTELQRSNGVLIVRGPEL